MSQDMDIDDLLSRSKVEQFAKDNDLIIVIPQPNELQIDLDTPEQIEYFEAAWRFLVLHYKGFDYANIHYDQVSRGGKGKHVGIRLKEDIEDIERIFLQILLGSDPWRELFSFMRVQRKMPQPTLFLENKPGTRAKLPKVKPKGVRTSFLKLRIPK